MAPTDTLAQQTAVALNACLVRWPTWLKDAMRERGYERVIGVSSDGLSDKESRARWLAFAVMHLETQTMFEYTEQDHKRMVKGVHGFTLKELLAMTSTHVFDEASSDTEAFGLVVILHQLAVRKLVFQVEGSTHKAREIGVEFAKQVRAAFDLLVPDGQI